MPAGLIDHEHSMGIRRDGLGDFREVQVHRLSIAGRQDQGCTLALPRTDRAEDVGRGSTLVPRRTWTGAALRPPPGDFVLLADASLVCEPDFYLVAVDCFFPSDFVQARGEAFLKSSITRSACA
jgi:hypothetical protein